MSRPNAPEALRIKVVSYLNASTTVWVVNPDSKRVEVYAPGKVPQTLDIGDTLDGGDVLSGFTLAVKDIFEG